MVTRHTVEPLESRRLLSVQLLGNLGTDFPSSSDPGGYVEAGGMTWFVANDTSGTPHLWRTDGTSAGTRPVAPTLTLTLSNGGAYPVLPASDGQTVYFMERVPLGQWSRVMAASASGGPPEAVLGGTAVTMVAPVAGGAVIGAGRTATAPEVGLHFTDGTAAGTRRIGAAYDAGGAAVVGGVAYFTAVGPGGERGLWRSDGTEAGTALVAPIAFAGVQPPQAPLNVVAAGARLYFAGYDAAAGWELWRSDGTAAGTGRVTDQSPGTGLGSDLSMVAAGGSLYFADEDASGPGLFRTTFGGTGGSDDPVELVFRGRASFPAAVGGRVYFAATDPATGAELWSVANGEPSARPVADVRPGPAGSAPFGLTPFADQLFFYAQLDGGEVQLWASDGSAAGTRPAYDATPGTGPTQNGTLRGRPRLIAESGGRLYFGIDDGSTGIEPYSTDGTAAGTLPLGDLDRRDGGSNPGSFVAGPEGTTYFGAGGRVWVTDGTPGGTRPLFDPAAGTPPVTGSPIAFVNGRVIVSRSGEVWATDGTAAGTERLTQEGQSLTQAPVRLGNVVFFATNSGTQGHRLYRTDGTAAGTHDVPVNSFRDPDVFPENPIVGLTAVGDRVLFQRNYLSGGTMGLFSTDGTAAGTVPLLYDPNTQMLPGGAAMGGRFYFARSQGPSLWETDGTPGGTREVVETRVYGGMIGAGDRVFFAGDGGLWVSDGTAGGTRRVSTVTPATGTRVELKMTGFGRDLLFVSGDKPWVSDGTAEGTRRLADVTLIQSEVSYGQSYQVVGDAAYFLATAPGEPATVLLMRTDGTPEGTVVDARVPARVGSSLGDGPHFLQGAGGHLFAVLRHAQYGSEPFAVLPPDAATSGVSVDARHVFYNGSAFDGGDAGAGPSDDAAVAPDKVPLDDGAVTGGGPTSAAVTGFIRGINGVMVDLAGLPRGVRLTADDFVFRSRPDAGVAPGPWRDGPRPEVVAVRRGAGAGGADRVTLVWREGGPGRGNAPVVNGWLEVTIHANQNTGLLSPDVFRVGNLAGDTANEQAFPFRVNALDVAAVKRNLTTAAVPVTNPYDLNKDGRVNALDLAAVKANLTHTLAALTATPPASAAVEVFSLRQTEEETWRAAEPLPDVLK